ncbi:hypothetical protein EGJ27_16050 [Pseudomonas sp. v388]|nr:hypothetical protein EGJ27_16050 [Pseudomonas sp. v388]
MPLIATAHLYIGYYTPQSIHDESTVFFIKKYPTLQMKFKNLYTRDGDTNNFANLNSVEANIVINYCKYRLGIDTRLENEEQLEECKRR